MMAKKVPDPAGNELKTDWNGTGTETEAVNTYIYS